MADCNNVFLEFDGILKLDQTRKDGLIVSRNSLRKKVQNWFQESEFEIGISMPEFIEQGSMVMDTIIRPIPRKSTKEEGERLLYHYDIDDGIHFQGNEDPEIRREPSTFHTWIVKAVTGHTEKDPIDKNTCVRTVFADGHHIDQPIYYKNIVSGTLELAHKNGWVDSDPKAIADWFNIRGDQYSQLRPLVRIVKAWCDFCVYSGAITKMPSGLVMTILITNNYMGYENRLDIALKETLSNIQANLSKLFLCERPTLPQGENLLDTYKYEQEFMKLLQDFINKATEALEETNQRKATEIWRQSLGDRFPLGADKVILVKPTDELQKLIHLGTKPHGE